jgi:uncharacterized protein
MHAKCKENVETAISGNRYGAAMTTTTVLLLLIAGFLGGIANAMAGGASLITFPAMMAAGLSPIPANASNTVAVVFGNIMGAWTERRKRPAFDGTMLAACGAALVGGVLGAVLLLNTPETVFVLIVPALIGMATLIFAFSRSIQTALAGRNAFMDDHLRTGLVLPAAVYGGYFGAGLGVIFMAVLSATSKWELRTTNAAKNILGVLTNAAAIVVFVFQNVISWPETLVMMAGCIAGGFAGAKALGFVSAATMRKAIIVVGSAMTVYYAWRYWV